MGQWDKLIQEILELNPNLRFDALSKALKKIGYHQEQPRGGSSHFTFRKAKHMPITIPKQHPLNKAYIELVRTAVMEYEAEKQSDSEQEQGDNQNG